MITDPLRIDTAAARHASREFARSADDIVRAAGEAVEAVDNVSGAYDRLRDSVLDLRTPLAESGLVDVGAGIANDLRLALDDPAIRQALLSQAIELQSTLSDALSKAAQGGGEGFEALLDSLSNQIETFGPALSLLGPKAAGFVEAVEAGIPLARLLAGNFGTVISDAEESLNLARSVLRTNAEIPRLREDLAKAEGERANVIREQLEARTQQTIDAFRDLVGTFGNATAGLPLSESFEGLAPARVVPLREVIQLLDRLSREANVPGLSEDIEKLMNALDPPTRDGRSLRDLLRSGITPINQELVPSQPDRLLQRASLVFPDPTGPLNGFAHRFPGDADASTGANLIVAQSLQDSIPLFDQFSSSAQRAFEDYANAATNVSGQVGDVIGKSLQGAEDALAQFVQTGKLDFKSLADSIIADLIRIAIRSAILGPIAQLLGGAFGGGSSFLDIAATRTSQPGGIGGFAQGGAFTVGGSGGTDSQMVRFRATPGERVTVTRPDRQDQAGGVNLNVQINNEVPEARVSAQATEGDNGTALRIQVARVIAEDVRAGGEVFRSFRDTFGTNPLRREVS